MSSVRILALREGRYLSPKDEVNSISNVEEPENGGGPGGNRTHGLLRARQSLSQLSYRPTEQIAENLTKKFIKLNFIHQYQGTTTEKWMSYFMTTFCRREAKTYYLDADTGVHVSVPRDVPPRLVNLPTSMPFGWMV